jgi:hypothetical protein
MSDQPAAVVETPAEITPEAAEAAERAEMSRVYRESRPDEAGAKPDAAADASVPPPAEEAAEKPETLAEVTAPTFLPDAAKAVWGQIPEAGRVALEKSYQEMTGKLANATRTERAVRPIYDVVIKAAQEIPTLADMTPQQIATDVFTMARLQGQFREKPVETLIGLAQQNGHLDALRAALAGDAAGAQQSTALAQEVRQLREQLAKVADPNMIDQRVSQQIMQRNLESEVDAFAATAEHWNSLVQTDAEGNVTRNDIATMLPLARDKKGHGASAKDVLALAYDMAVNADPELRAKIKAAVAPLADPRKAADAARAASINVSSRGGSEPATQSERETLRQAYRSAQRG